MPVRPHTREIELLSQLALADDGAAAVEDLAPATEEVRAKFVKLAHGHHVVVRALRPLQSAASAAGAAELADWATRSLAAEEARIANALEYLDAICRELELAGCRTTVMKSLDHWPDIGNDLDLYTEADVEATQRVMQQKFQATAQSRTWGDRSGYMRTMAAPQARPAPRAQRSTVWPGLMRPSRTASSRAMGMEADEVLPYSATFSTNFCRG